MYLLHSDCNIYPTLPLFVLQKGRARLLPHDDNILEGGGVPFLVNLYCRFESFFYLCQPWSNWLKQAVSRHDH